MKNILIYSPCRFREEVWLPALWSQAKTYYEIHGEKRQEWHWPVPYIDVHSHDLSAVKKILEEIKPTIFAVSLYVWNYWIGHEIAAWVKFRWPDCLVITGGPHQYFYHDNDWFKKHPYIDASLPGECFGELCFKEILDNLDDDGKIDFNQITDLWYPMRRSRSPRVSKKRSDKAQRKLFDYNWPSYSGQASGILDFIDHARSSNRKCKFQAILETTRGCPYGCTYCDWGGGISTTVIKKDTRHVFDDINFLCSIDLRYLYFADANFGIFNDRDVSIIEYLVKKRIENASFVRIGYGGFAKTDNRLETVKKIIEIDLDSDLSNNQEIKISMQSLDEEVLRNIDRKNVSLKKQLDAFIPLSNKKKYPIYVEMILGLPGMNLEKFYKELDILGSDDLSVYWFEWVLLPESPAYSKEYRDKFNIKTVRKINGWAVQETVLSEQDIVVAGSNFDENDYLEMLLATSWYHAMIRGGILKKSLRYIDHRLPIGKIIRDMIVSSGMLESLSKTWQEIIRDKSLSACVDIGDSNVYLGYYAPAWLYFNRDDFSRVAEDVLVNHYAVPKKILKKDLANLTRACGQKPWPLISSELYLYQNSGNIFSPKSLIQWIKELINSIF